MGLRSADGRRRRQHAARREPAVHLRVFESPRKLSDACAETWAAILKAVPKSRLVLLAAPSAKAAESLTERFTKLGVASDTAGGRLRTVGERLPLRVSAD